MEATLNALRGGRDVLQGMSNAAAGAVSVPVDVLAWALRKAGVPVGDDPVGGSDWMKRKGLTREPENRVAGVIGESIGGVLPMVASAKAPQIAAGVNQMIDNAMAPRRMNPQAGAIVWHGSPHGPFPKFDASKIGSGEGAQAYGMGHYTAGARATGEEYRKSLSDIELLHNGQRVGVFDKDPAANAAHQIRATGGDIQKAIKRAQNLYTGNWRDNVVNEIQRLGPGNVSERLSGYLYKVDLPDEAIGRMLDWDKPLSQQAQAKAALDRIGKEISLPRMQDAEGMGFAYQHLANAVGGPKNAAALLRNEGIPGIRYLDQGSRAAGQGTSNYVVFPGNEDLLKILEINDQPVQAVIDALRNKR